MSGLWTTIGQRGVLLGLAVVTAACSSLNTTPSRPSPGPVVAPAPAPTDGPLPTAPPASEPSARTIPSSPTPAPPRDVAPAPRPQSDASSASSVLLQQSRTQRAAGSLPTAKASLERALRLDPNNPEIWLELGEIELQTGNASQAATMARKALTLAGRDGSVTARAERLLRAAE
ncbi:MAG TPA: tetratricopeptide repeat protein [Gammaproteobacteria bacterium]